MSEILSEGKSISGGSTPVEEGASCQGRFLYAVILSDGEREFGNIGLDEGGVYTIPYKDIAAVVSDHPVTTIKLLRKNLSPYHLTLRTVAETCTTIPARFGQIAEDGPEMFRVLGNNYSRLRKELERLHDKVEMGLKVFWDVENIFEYFLNKDRELETLRNRVLHRRGSPLTRAEQIEVGAFFYDKMNKMRERVTEKVVAILKDSIVEVKIDKPTDEKMVMNGGCLVWKNRRKDFEGMVEKAAGFLGKDYALKIAGPWVPFYFVEHIKLF